MPLKLDVEDGDGEYGGDDDGDDKHPQPPERARKRRRVAGACAMRGAQNGPGTAREAVRWAPTDLQALHDSGLAHFGVDFRKRALAVLQRGVEISTDYSGIGGAEESLDKIAIAASEAMKHVASLALPMYQCVALAICSPMQEIS